MPAGDQTRGRILAHVKERPGVIKKDLALELGLGWGTVVYQVGLLVERGELKLIKHRGFDRLFPVELSSQETAWICGLSADYGEQILAVLNEDQHRQVYEIAEELDASRKVIARALGHLRRAELVEREGQRYPRYRLVTEARAFLNRWNRTSNERN